MIMAHSGLARGLADQLGLPQSVRDAVAASYERWDGRGWPGELAASAEDAAAICAPT
jgi:HD domain